MPIPPLVSVCMTTYNHASYLAEAIEGVLAQQTAFDVELVIGEDCSTDDTRAVCEAYVAKYPDRIRLVTSAKNVGWRANYRRTFEACRGKYVAYCDGDDWWCDPQKLQLQVDLMESDPACGMCYTGADEYHQISGLLKPDPDHHYTRFEDMLLGISVPNCTTLARRELIASYYADIRPEEHPEWRTDDWPMWLWFSVHSQIRFIDRITAVHRRVEGSVSHAGTYRNRIAFRNSVMGISLWFDERYTASRHRFRIHRRRSRVNLWILSLNGTFGEFLGTWWDDVRQTPRLLLCPEGVIFLTKKVLNRIKNRHS
ncbi:MAG: glycosyltransferase [Rikenellaceae bacterium]|nr:glycosyltransferase [Rikenellaceae bacterium]